MTLSFPRAIPDPALFDRVQLTLSHAQAAIPTRGGVNAVADLGPALWVASPQTVTMPISALREWTAFLDSLRGGIRTLLMYDPDYDYPQAHPAGGSLGTPLVSSFDIDAGTITLKGLSANTTTLTAGDRMSIAYAATSHYGYHTVTEGGTADGSGNLTVSVEPTIITGIAANDPIDLTRPQLEMRLVPGSVKVEDRIGMGSLSFQAVQYVRTA